MLQAPKSPLREKYRRQTSQQCSFAHRTVDVSPGYLGLTRPSDSAASAEQAFVNLVPVAISVPVFHHGCQHTNDLRLVVRRMRLFTNFFQPSRCGCLRSWLGWDIICSSFLCRRMPVLGSVLAGRAADPISDHLAEPHWTWSVGFGKLSL